MKEGLETASNSAMTRLDTGSKGATKKSIFSQGRVHGQGRVYCLNLERRNIILSFKGELGIKFQTKVTSIKKDTVAKIKEF